MAMTLTGMTITGGMGLPKELVQTAVYAWGYNNNGQLGINTIFSRSSPVLLGAASSAWVNIMGGSSSMSGGVKADGTMWIWGLGAPGLGLNDNISRSSPVQIGSLTTWSSVRLVSTDSIAVKTDGTLWAWGSNSSGQLGLNNTTTVSSPIQVGISTNWTSKLAGFVHAGQNSFAIDSTGRLYAWGPNNTGQLGLNDAITRSSPTQVGTGTNWSQIFGGDAAMAIRTDGTLWTWSGGPNGELGLNIASAYRSSPTQVGALTDWLNCISAPVSGGGQLILKSNGTLWAWGDNRQGQLGDGTAISRSSPIQLGSLNTWTNVGSSVVGGFATKSDGTLWSWGQNFNGTIGDSTSAPRSSPVQIGSAIWANSLFGSGYQIYVAPSA